MEARPGGSGSGSGSYTTPIESDSSAEATAYGQHIWNDSTNNNGVHCAIAPPFAIDTSSSDFDWLLAHNTLLPSTPADQHNRHNLRPPETPAFTRDETGWYDVGAGIERRFSQSSSLWDGSTRSALKSKAKGVKRRRTTKPAGVSTPISINGLSGSEVSLQARQRALQQISASRWKEDCLAEVDHFTCEDRHCFAMEPMGKDPRGYLGEPIRIDELEVRVIEPPLTGQRIPTIPSQNLPTVRQVGRSLHIILTKYPRMSEQEKLESGFALMIVCHKHEKSSEWLLLCLVSFNGAAENKRLTREGAHFVANLDRYTKAESGKRIWGERTSHVRKNQLPAKPLRLEPRGAAASFLEGQHYSVVVTLHDSQGNLLRDVDGRLCIAQSNPFFFEDQRDSLTQESRQLLEQFEKLSVSQKTILASASQSIDARQALLSNSHNTQEAAGVFITTKDKMLPLSACPLAEFQPSILGPMTAEYTNRLHAVAAFLGRKHANVNLTDGNISYLRTVNGIGLEGRYRNLYVSGNLQEQQAWLEENGIWIKINDVFTRGQALRGLMYVRDYRSQYIICVDDVNPDAIIVDKEDPHLVYCLHEKAGHLTLDLADRHYPLARLAFTSRLPRAMIPQVLWQPYAQAFKQAGGNGTKEEPIQPEKFWLILHLIFLDYFCYWVEYRNAGSCARIQARLLEDDELLDDKFFKSGNFIKFSR